MLLLCKRYKDTAYREASGSASTYSANVPSPSGQTPTRLRHINTLSCRFLLFRNSLLQGPASSAATHIFGTLSLSKVTAQLGPSSDACIREVLDSNPDRKHSTDFFLVAFHKLSGQMSEYYIQFCHGRFLPYAVTGGFVKQPLVAT
jgi:hypothetical protein